MAQLAAQIDELQRFLGEYRQKGLKEYPTRTIFIDPLLESLGWKIRDPSEVEHEYPTPDGKSVDYCLKLGGEAVLLVEAKPLGDKLEDIKVVNQIVNYANTEGIDWCVLTNGTEYHVYYCGTMKGVRAQEKRLFTLSIDPEASGGTSATALAEQFLVVSREEVARGALSERRERLFTDRKVRCAQDKLFESPPNSFIALIRKRTADQTLMPRQIAKSLQLIWSGLTVTRQQAAAPASPMEPAGQTPETRTEARPGRRPRAELPRMRTLMVWGLVKAGDALLIRNHGDESEAIVVDHKKVQFRGQELGFNEWGQKVTGWTSICIYEWAVPKGGSKTLAQLRSERIEHEAGQG